MPCYLKPCFLFVGLFPEDFEIPVHRLILLWIAEGFIEQTTGLNLEERAMEYLEDLISRNLVMVDRLSPAGQIKTCRMHDMVRDFSLDKARVNLLQEIKKSKGSSFNLTKSRLISIHSNVVSSFISSQPYGPCVRTFVHCSNEETVLEPGKVSFIPDSFKLLWSLEAMPLLFTRFPFFLTELIHLRYIALSSDFMVLPEEISRIWNIQTLIIKTTKRALKVKPNIWNFVRLRHLETNASMILLKAGECGNNENLQTLFNVSPQSCTAVFEKAPNLKKLGIRGLLTVLLDDKDQTCSFDGLEKLHRLETLKLLNDQHTAPEDAKLSRLPAVCNFPPSLISLTLSYTLLDWKHMSILEGLEKLRVLKLKNDAFVGGRWEVCGAGFPRLEVLRIRYADLSIWEASSHHFPKLEHLSLRNCEELRGLPLELAEASSLREVNLYRTTEMAADSARKIQGMIQEKRGSEIGVSVYLSGECFIPQVIFG